MKRTVLALLGMLAGMAVQAAPPVVIFGVQPVLGEDETRVAYGPLVAYLAEQTGLDVRLSVSRDYFSYWTRVQRGDFDIVMDAAHFTGYRLKHGGWQLLARLENTVSYSVVTMGDRQVIDLRELIGKRIAAQGPPSLGAIQLERIFENPIREPVIMSEASADDAVEAVQTGAARAALLPTRLLQRYPHLYMVESLPAVPHMAISASSMVGGDVKTAIQRAVLGAGRTDAGRAMLETLNLGQFVTADAEDYEPFAAWLESSRITVGMVGAQ